MLLNQEQLDTFHLQGFINAGKVLDDQTVEKLRDELQKVLEGRAKKAPRLNHTLGKGEKDSEPSSYGKTVYQVVNMWEVSEAFYEHAKTLEITQTVARLCNNTDTIRIWHDQVQFKPPKTGGATGWHQDYPLWPIMVPGDLVSAWVALDDADVDNGCMWMVPGSHRWGQVPLQSGEKFEPTYDASLLPQGVKVKAVAMPVKKGEVAFHHCMTWHGSPMNLSDRPRRAIAVHYMPGYTVYKPSRPHVMQKAVTVKPGDFLEGEHFPIVYQRDCATANI